MALIPDTLIEAIAEWIATDAAATAASRIWGVLGATADTYDEEVLFPAQSAAHSARVKVIDLVTQESWGKAIDTLAPLGLANGLIDDYTELYGER